MGFTQVSASDKRTQRRMMRISECTAADNDFLLRYIIFVYLQKAFYVLFPQSKLRAFCTRILADVVWRWRPLVTGAASLPGFAFSGHPHTGKLARLPEARRESIAQKY